MSRARAGWSLSRRLGLRLAAVMFCAMLLGAATIAWRTFATLSALDDAALQDQEAVVAAHLETDAAGRPVVRLPPAVAAAFRSSDDDNIWLISDAENRPLSSSAPAQAPALAAFLPVPGYSGLFGIPPSNRQPRGMIGYVTTTAGWRVAVLQGREQSDTIVDSLTQEFLTSAVWLLLPLGTLTVLVGVLTVRHGLRPLRRVSAAAASVGPNYPGVRLPEDGLPRELAPLVGTVNDALVRMEDGLEAQRRFVGEAAHALRTPLAVLTARLDALPDGAETGALRQDVDRMARLVGQMLRIARLEVGRTLDVTQCVDLHATGTAAVGALAPLAIRRGIDLALTGATGPCWTLGNPPALEIALTNLIENALAHAPAGSIVEVDVAPPATLRVLDRGAGVPVDERRVIFGRFHRGRSARPDGGAGLGLAIVAGIAAAHRGSVEATAREGGGAVFVLTLPPDPAASGR